LLGNSNSLVENFPGGAEVHAAVAVKVHDHADVNLYVNARTDSRFVTSTAQNTARSHAETCPGWASAQVSGNGGSPSTVAALMPPGLSFGIVKVALRLMPGAIEFVFPIGRLIVTRLPSICVAVTLA